MPSFLLTWINWSRSILWGRWSSFPRTFSQHEPLLAYWCSHGQAGCSSASLKQRNKTQLSLLPGLTMSCCLQGSEVPPEAEGCLSVYELVWISNDIFLNPVGIDGYCLEIFCIPLWTPSQSRRRIQDTAEKHQFEGLGTAFKISSYLFASPDPATDTL